MPPSRTNSSAGPGSPDVFGFYDEDTGSVQYLVACPATRKAATIDVVQGFDPRSAATDVDAARHILRFAESEGLEIEWVLDTHPHADHAMASAWLAAETGAPNAIGEKVVEIARLWRDLYNLPDAFDPTRDFARLFADGDTFAIGTLPVRVMLSPGHTLGSITYVVGDDAAFVHDTLMQPDVGTTRADFPGGSAEDLWDSLQKILALPDETRLFVGHDYGTGDRAPQWEATVREHRRHNAHIGGGVTKSEFIETRQARDRTLPLPDRMLHVLQMNLRAGKAPPAEGDGHSYLRIPLNRF
ncbi:MBL fold metallo-hydrolase [Silicimonas algicola]|uniref:Glyoxylase-like metal-dependent hydrolase (Beta-lactamase superfamily II) n=1 Tax=Silicimonas algicola TaxID=1826607 RepID=A0A316GDA5_9RHOB|nr:MBL fold metallo-hydrolase [Silicimonas algicola]AZQ66360.1 MBL fold metallo-hydrolase [Silicimonas algicola]PWK58692.1 glyoxylase-like metal-dependent hydrolase (beta-lactamase superfamily II) [Silicimonas algicola]